MYAFLLKKNARQPGYGYDESYSNQDISSRFNTHQHGYIYNKDTIHTQGYGKESSNMSKYVCAACGYAYSAENHEPDYAEGQDVCQTEGLTACPVCGCGECSEQD